MRERHKDKNPKARRHSVIAVFTGFFCFVLTYIMLFSTTTKLKTR